MYKIYVQSTNYIREVSRGESDSERNLFYVEKEWVMFQTPTFGILLFV